MKIIPQFQWTSDNFSVLDISFRPAIDSPTPDHKDGKRVNIFIFVILGIGFIAIYG